MRDLPSLALQVLALAHLGLLVVCSAAVKPASSNLRSIDHKGICETLTAIPEFNNIISEHGRPFTPAETKSTCNEVIRYLLEIDERNLGEHQVLSVAANHGDVLFANGGCRREKMPTDEPISMIVFLYEAGMPIPEERSFGHAGRSYAMRAIVRAGRGTTMGSTLRFVQEGVEYWKLVYSHGLELNFPPHGGRQHLHPEDAHVVFFIVDDVIASGEDQTIKAKAPFHGIEADGESLPKILRAPKLDSDSVHGIEVGEEPLSAIIRAPNPVIDSGIFHSFKADSEGRLSFERAFASLSQMKLHISKMDSAFSLKAYLEKTTRIALQSADGKGSNVPTSFSLPLSRYHVRNEVVPHGLLFPSLQPLNVLARTIRTETKIIGFFSEAGQHFTSIDGFIVENQLFALESVIHKHDHAVESFGREKSSGKWKKLDGANGTDVSSEAVLGPSCTRLALYCLVQVPPLTSVSGKPSRNRTYFDLFRDPFIAEALSSIIASIDRELFTNGKMWAKSFSFDGIECLANGLFHHQIHGTISDEGGLDTSSYRGLFILDSVGRNARDRQTIIDRLPDDTLAFGLGHFEGQNPKESLESYILKSKTDVFIRTHALIMPSGGGHFLAKSNVEGGREFWSGTSNGRPITATVLFNLQSHVNLDAYEGSYIFFYRKLYATTPLPLKILKGALISPLEKAMANSGVGSQEQNISGSLGVEGAARPLAACFEGISAMRLKDELTALPPIERLFATARLEEAAAVDRYFTALALEAQRIADPRNFKLFLSTQEVSPERPVNMVLSGFAQLSKAVDEKVIDEDTLVVRLLSPPTGVEGDGPLPFISSDCGAVYRLIRVSWDEEEPTGKVHRMALELVMKNTWQLIGDQANPMRTKEQVFEMVRGRMAAFLYVKAEALPSARKLYGIPPLMYKSLLRCLHSLPPIEGSIGNADFEALHVQDYLVGLLNYYPSKAVGEFSYRSSLSFANSAYSPHEKSMLIYLEKHKNADYSLLLEASTSILLLHLTEGQSLPGKDFIMINGERFFLCALAKVDHTGIYAFYRVDSMDGEGEVLWKLIEGRDEDMASIKSSALPSSRRMSAFYVRESQIGDAEPSASAVLSPQESSKSPHDEIVRGAYMLRLYLTLYPIIEALNGRELLEITEYIQKMCRYNRTVLDNGDIKESLRVAAFPASKNESKVTIMGGLKEIGTIVDEKTVIIIVIAANSTDLKVGERFVTNGLPFVLKAILRKSGEGMILHKAVPEESDGALSWIYMDAVAGEPRQKYHSNELLAPGSGTLTLAYVKDLPDKEQFRTRFFADISEENRKADEVLKGQLSVLSKQARAKQQGEGSTGQAVANAFSGRTVAIPSSCSSAIPEAPRDGARSEGLRLDSLASFTDGRLAHCLSRMPPINFFFSTMALNPAKGEMASETGEVRKRNGKSSFRRVTFRTLPGLAGTDGVLFEGGDLEVHVKEKSISNRTTIMLFPHFAAGEPSFSKNQPTWVSKKGKTFILYAVLSSRGGIYCSFTLSNDAATGELSWHKHVDSSEQGAETAASLEDATDKAYDRIHFYVRSDYTKFTLPPTLPLEWGPSHMAAFQRCLYHIEPVRRASLCDSSSSPAFSTFTKALYDRKSCIFTTKGSYATSLSFLPAGRPPCIFHASMMNVRGHMFSGEIRESSRPYIFALTLNVGQGSLNGSVIEYEDTKLVLHSILLWNRTTASSYLSADGHEAIAGEEDGLFDLVTGKKRVRALPADYNDSNYNRMLFFVERAKKVEDHLSIGSASTVFIVGLLSLPSFATLVQKKGMLLEDMSRVESWVNEQTSEAEMMRYGDILIRKVTLERASEDGNEGAKHLLLIPYAPDFDFKKSLTEETIIAGVSLPPNVSEPIEDTFTVNGLVFSIKCLLVVGNMMDTDVIIRNYQTKESASSASESWTSYCTNAKFATVLEAYEQYRGHQKSMLIYEKV